MENWLIWSCLLFAVGVLIAIIEVMIPSGGLLAVVALFCFCSSIACAYEHSGWAAIVMGCAQGICVPLTILWAFKVLPKTSLGKKLILATPDQRRGDENQKDNRQLTLQIEQYQNLVGCEGVLVTPLRPSGTVEINGERISVVSDGEPIPKGTRVRVTQVEGNRIVVKAADA